MVPAASDKVPRASPYSGFLFEFPVFRLQEFHLLCYTFPNISSTLSFFLYLLGPTTPTSKSWFGLFPFRSPLLRESIFLSLPPVTKMFQFTGLLSLKLCIHFRISMLPLMGSPIRISPDQSVLLLPEAFRRSPRPSSASSA